MGFTVCPRSHVVRPPCDNTAGTDAVLPVDAGRFSDDLSEFVYFGQVVTVDPFSAAVVDGVGVNSVGEGGVCGGELGDFLRGRDCRMDLGGSEWGRFCQDFLLVAGGGLQTQADLVVLVDSLLNGVVCALTGCGEYADRAGSSNARLMRFVGQLYVLLVLCGGVGVFPMDVAMRCYDGGVSGVDGCVEDYAVFKVFWAVCLWAYSCGLDSWDLGCGY